MQRCRYCFKKGPNRFKQVSNVAGQVVINISSSGTRAHQMVGTCRSILQKTNCDAKGGQAATFTEKSNCNKNIRTYTHASRAPNLFGGACVTIICPCMSRTLPLRPPSQFSPQVPWHPSEDVDQYLGARVSSTSTYCMQICPCRSTSSSMAHCTTCKPQACDIPPSKNDGN